MLQLRLWSLVCGSFMWQKPINHSCSLTGPLQHTEAHTLTPTHTHTNMHEHPHARAPAPAATYTEEHALLSPKHDHLPPMCIPSNHQATHPTRPSIHPSTHPSLHLPADERSRAVKSAFISFSKRTQSQRRAKENKLRAKCYVNCKVTSKQSRNDKSDFSANTRVHRAPLPREAENKADYKPE